MTKKPTDCHVRIDPAVYAALVKAAKQQGRSMTKQAEFALAEWLRAGGWLRK